MATYYPSTPWPAHFVNPDTGELLSGGILRAYVAGTTTPTPMYRDGDGTTAGEAITLNAGGYPTVSSNIIVIWLDADVDYKFTLENALGSQIWSVDDIAHAASGGGSATTCKTIADLTSALGPLLTNGERVTSDQIAAMANTGAILETTWNNTTSKRGDGKYELKTRAQHRTDIGNPTWVPDGYGDHYLLGSTTYVAVLQADCANAFQYGAKGDGVSDDTLPIQAVLDATLADKYLPAATYLCGKLSLLASNPSGVTLRGDGKTRTKILSSAAADYSLNVYAASGSNTSGVKIKDLWIDGNDTATTAYFYRNTNMVLDSVQITNHVGKNCHIERSYQVHVRNSVFITYEANEADCALYLATNGITVDSENYFQTGGTAPGIIVDDFEVSGNNCYGVVIRSNVFEVCTVGVQVTADIDTSGLVIDDNYMEMVAPTTAIGVSFSGGFHNNVSIQGNHITEVAASVVIDAVDRKSVFTIENNRLYRPILITTTINDTARFAGFDLPAVTIPYQHIQFAHATYDFPHEPTVIVDAAFSFSSLSVEKITVIGLDTAYNRIMGRTYYQSVSDTPTNLITFYLPDDGGFTQAFCMSGNIGLTWRRAPQSLTGSSSAHSEMYDIRFIARNSGVGHGISVAETPEILTTFTEVITAVELVISGGAETLDLQATGEVDISLNEWMVKFDISYAQ